MPTRGSGTIGYAELQQYMGGNNPVTNSEYRGRDGSWRWGAIYNADSYYCRPRPYFLPRPGSERLTYWFRATVSGQSGWIMQFNPTVTAAGGGTTVYYNQLNGSASSAYPSQFSSVWRASANIFFKRDIDGRRYFFIQAHNNVSGYRATLGYAWNAS
jgi:hypothetical protein